MPRQSDYLVLRGSKYSFRYTVPTPLRGIIGKREFKEALGESDYETARKKAARLRVKADAEVEAAWGVLRAKGQQTPKWVSSLSDDELGRLTMGHAPRDVADGYGDYTLFPLVEGMKAYRIPGFKLPAPPPQFRP